MKRTRFIIPVLMLSLFFTGLFLVQSNIAMAAGNLSWGSQGNEVVTLQQTLNTQGYWCGETDGIFGSQA